MDAESWNDLGALIVNVLALPPEERIDFLDEECGADTALRAEVELRLADYDKAPSYFDSLGEGLIPRVDDLEELPAGDFTPDPYLLIGREVAHYRVTEHLGGGGMGVVYKAEDTRLQRTVALKFLPPFLKDDAQARRRFLQEARAASALDHPNICTVYEIKETEEGRLFIAMAYYEGETLKKKIARGPLPLDTALDLTLQTARGLAHAHARGIVHRDVKPANVMVTQEGLVKVLDFGLAKLAGSAQITRTGTTLGTVAYMPPEQARGEVVDHRADIWSLGAVFYELVAGQRAFPGDYH
ncbi:MAG: serine/threonine-protein kinase, partial [Rhodothermales bacterium]